MIDPLSALIHYFAGSSDLCLLVGDRVAGKHKFNLDDGESTYSWPTPSTALTVALDAGGEVDASNCSSAWQGRCALRCYGPSSAEAMQLYVSLASLLNRAKQTTSTPAGTALIYYLVEDTPPTTAFDADLEIDFVLAFAAYRIARMPLED